MKIASIRRCELTARTNCASSGSNADCRCGVYDINGITIEKRDLPAVSAEHRLHNLSHDRRVRAGKAGIAAGLMNFRPQRGAENAAR